MELPIAREIDNNFETYVVECPHCKKEISFSRSTDLANIIKPFMMVAGNAVVDCLNPECKQPFRIKDNRITEKHEYLILDCYELIERKRYMFCILNLCTACEAFFLKGIEVKLLWEPWSKDVFEGAVEAFNKCSTALHNKIRRYTFTQLRNVFFDLYINNRSFASQKEILTYIEKGIKGVSYRDPLEVDILRCSDQKSQVLFRKLNDLSINDLRNEVVHKSAFRPLKKHAERHLAEVREVVEGLEARLNIKHMIAYLRGRP